MLLVITNFGMLTFRILPVFFIRPIDEPAIAEREFGLFKRLKPFLCSSAEILEASDFEKILKDVRSM